MKEASNDAQHTDESGEALASELSLEQKEKLERVGLPVDSFLQKVVLAVAQQGIASTFVHRALIEFIEECREHEAEQALSDDEGLNLAVRFVVLSAKNMCASATSTIGTPLVVPQGFVEQTTPAVLHAGLRKSTYNRIGGTEEPESSLKNHPLRERMRTILAEHDNSPAPKGSS